MKANVVRISDSFEPLMVLTAIDEETEAVVEERVRYELEEDDDALAPARGLITGVGLGLAFWALIIAAFLIW
jgi:hypothetical protein